MTPFEIVGLYIALNLLLLLTLAFRVGQVRMKEKVSLGDGKNFKLQQRIRAHANYTENAPLALIGLFILAKLSAPPVALHIFGAAFLIARLSHAIGMEGENAVGKGRPLGMILMIVTLLAQALYILFLIFA